MRTLRSSMFMKANMTFGQEKKKKKKHGYRFFLLTALCVVFKDREKTAGGREGHRQEQQTFFSFISVCELSVRAGLGELECVLSSCE